jgi:hypothetical protein
MSILRHFNKHHGYTHEGKRTPLGGGKGGGAPPPPDYAALARQTAAGNVEAARIATRANRINQVTPYGSLTYTQNQTPTFNAEGYRTALDAYNQARQSYQPQTDEYGNVTNPMTMTAPNYKDYMSKVDPDSGWTATQTLSPEQQKLLDYQNQISMGLGELAGQGLGYVSDMLNSPFDTSGLAPMRYNIGQEDFTRAGNAPNLQTSIGQNAGMEGWDRASNLMMQRLDPQLQRQQEQQDAQLAAQGIPIGSEAYTRAKQDLAMQQNDLRTQAQLQAQNVQQNLFGQELQAGQFGNQAMLGQNAAQLQNLGFNNQQIQQFFANQMANANLSNQARQQGLSEAAYLRNEPLNTLNAVRSGSQVTGPQFVNSFNQATTQGADLLGAGQMGYNAQMGAYNAGQAGQNSMMGGLMDLGGAAIMRYSDVRLKENIKPIGVLANGLTLYTYKYIDAVKLHPLAGEGVQVGVMAQEVEQVYPYAVTTLNDGYKTVNYGLLP